MIDQNSQFMAILTAVGEAKQANADALGIPWTFSKMGVGDANGTDPIPSRTQTQLINERNRAPLNQVKVDPKNTNVVIAEQVIPENVGGWWIREIGLYDADGDLVAVANCAPSFKPLLTQGSGKTQVVRMNFIVTSAANVTLKIDPSVVLATRQYVDDRIIEVLPPTRTPGSYTRVVTDKRGVVIEGSNPDTLAEIGIKDAYTKEQIDGALKLKAPLANPSFTGKPIVPTPALNSNDLQAANTEFVQAVIAALVGGAPGALDTLKELAAALGGDPNFANTIINALALKANKDEAMPLGEGGWGTRIVAAYTDMKAIDMTCFSYQIPTAGTLNGFGNAAGSVLTAYSQNSGWQAYIRDNVFMFRGHTGGVWTEDFTVWHSGNLDLNQVLPAGTSIDYAGPVAPTGFLKENGAAISRATYARLFAAIGIRYGAGNGSTTFNLPDSRGEVFRGLDEGRGIDRGRTLGSVQLDQVQGMKYPMSWGQGAIVTGGAYAGNDLRRYSVATTLPQLSAPISDGVNGTPRIGAETRMRNVARLKCIKY